MTAEKDKKAEEETKLPYLFQGIHGNTYIL